MNYNIGLLEFNENSFYNNYILASPMDQFEIKPFFGEFLGLNYTPIGLFTISLFYIFDMMPFGFTF